MLEEKTDNEISQLKCKFCNGMAFGIMRINELDYVLNCRSCGYENSFRFNNKEGDSWQDRREYREIVK